MSSAGLTGSSQLREDPPVTERPSPSVESSREAAEQHLTSGAPLLAYDAVVDALRVYPRDVRLRQLLALSMARSGATQAAAAVLEQLVAEGHDDEETLGLLARTYKDVAFDAVDTRERRSALARAFDRYLDAYRRSGGYWTGINAATLALLLGRPDEAARLARDVRDRSVALLAATRPSDEYWLLATVAEAALVLGTWDEAVTFYARAAAAGRARLGDLVSTRRNARRILEAVGRDRAALDGLFDIPRIVVFAGHLVDTPDRPSLRFPAVLEPLVREAIRATVADLRPGLGYASAANGGDILFLETLASIGAESHVVLPYNAEQFRSDSVATAGNAWSDRFDRVLAGAAEVVIASDQPLGSRGLSFEYGFRLLDGTACIRADELETELVCLALWDGEAGDGPGGTAAAVEHWRRAGRRLEILDLAAIRSRGRAMPQPPTATAVERRTTTKSSTSLRAEIVALLFADVRGFSRLSEAEMPLFLEHCLGEVARVLARAASPPLFVNTWGDGLYLVFADAGAAGEFALALNDAMRRVDWRAKGFSTDLAMRVGLHAGPAYACVDPVTGRPNYIGAHVSRAARIEPIAPPGEVYASGAFAALARSDGVRRFRCAYVGQTPLAKNYGTFPTYVLRPR